MEETKSMERVGWVGKRRVTKIRGEKTVREKN